MAAVAHLKGVSVLVYEADGQGGFRRIGTFEPPSGAPSTSSTSAYASLYAPKRKEVRILYQGGVHYDALDTSGAALDYFGSHRASSSSPAQGSALRDERMARGGGIGSISYTRPYATSSAYTGSTYEGGTFSSNHHSYAGLNALM